MAKFKRLRLPVGFTRNSFRRHAKPFEVKFGHVQIGVAHPREHSTGSMGFRLDHKMQLKINGIYVWAQVNCTVTIIGSKDLPQEPVDVADTSPQQPMEMKV